jgi:hypothetical protein
MHALPVRLGLIASLGACALAAGCGRGPSDGGDPGGSTESGATTTTEAVVSPQSAEASAAGLAAPGPAAPTGVPGPSASGTEASARDDSAELALLNGLTAALEARKLDDLAACLAPEFLAELRQLHDRDPADFWARGAAWVEQAASGLTLVSRQSSDGFPRWRGLVRFGSGAEESVTFGRFDGRVLLADL